VKMLPQATNQAPPAKSGKLWRWLVGEEDEEPAEPSPSPGRAPVRREPPPPASSIPDSTTVQARVAQLETGLRLLAEATKRVHLDLSKALADLRSEMALTATPTDVRRALNETMEPLAATIEQLSDTAQALPLTLGSIAERLTAKVDALQIDLEETLIALIPVSWDGLEPPPAPH
jgi:hypothetical protein